jgi:hypothetical protein
MSRYRVHALLVTVLAVLAAVVVIGASPALAAGVSATFSKDSDWGTGYQARYTIVNGTGAPITSWRVQFDLPGTATMGSYWDALVAVTGQHVVADNRTYNGTLTPGASTTFGFLVSGSGSPVNCTINGVSCGGTTVPSTTTTTRTTPPTTNPPPPPPGSIRVAPYVDMGSWPTPSLTELATAGNLNSFTLAFITASGCHAMWFNAYDPRQAWSRDQIDAIRARGGDVKVSFGGASGIELAQACTTVDSLLVEYQAVVSAYALRSIDLDIEGAATAEPASVARRSTALARLQQANPGLRVSLTLPVLPEGLTADGLNVVRSARDAGVAVDVVNVMAMDYYRTGDYGDFAVQAARSTFTQLTSLYPGRSAGQVWRMVGVTPMLGQNDDSHVYDQNDARQLVSFGNTNHLGLLAFWEMTRDRNACTGALYRCTNIAQAPYEFSRIFAGLTG